MLRSVMAAGLVLASTAALADNRTDCMNNKDHDLRIKSCSAMIQQNPMDVVAYHNRGDAYGLKGDFDHAIADYTKAIEINPNYAPAYNGRGRAYTSKGDYAHAVADVTRATELAPKPVPKQRPASAAPKAAAHKSKQGQMKSGLAAPKPELSPPAGMVSPHKSKETTKTGFAVSGEPPVVGNPPDGGSWPEWAQSKLKN
jgi:tetratricopeptide (TPR) repeat protein